MRLHSISIILALLAAAFNPGCETIVSVKDSVNETWDEFTLPDLPREIYVHTTTYRPAQFSPWKPPNPFEYEGKYYGEFGDTSEYLEIEIFGKDEGIEIMGSKRVETAGRAPVTTPIPPSILYLEYDPFFRALRMNSFFVVFTDPGSEVFPEPVAGIVHGNLFYAKEEPPPPVEPEEEERSYPR